MTAVDIGRNWAESHSACHYSSGEPTDKRPIIDHTLKISGGNFGYSPEWQPGEEYECGKEFHG